MGTPKDPGIIPRTCCELFERIKQARDGGACLNVEVHISYLEIYNEKVRDLLNPNNQGNLKVREHPRLGPYVQGLSRLAVSSFAEMNILMNEGNKTRTVASTHMNESSSRSHAIFTIVLTSRQCENQGSDIILDKVSRISLVDLAGSERADSTGATGVRLQEGANINKSLTTLGKVIASLAEQAMHARKKPRKLREHFIPYRDSTLTWLLKDSLGGNSKTAMIATISPTDYEETLSTLRYADQAKKIKNKAIINEDSNTKLIRDLKEELQVLRKSLSLNKLVKDESHSPLASPLECVRELERSSIEGQHDIYPPKNAPHLVNLNEDPLMAECLRYHIRLGITRVGQFAGKSDIRLSGQGVQNEHCWFENKEGTITLYPQNNSMTMVNGIRIQQPKILHNGFRILLGDYHVFRFNHPEEVRQVRTSTSPSSVSAVDRLDSVCCSPIALSADLTQALPVAGSSKAIQFVPATPSNFGGKRVDNMIVHTGQPGLAGDPRRDHYENTTLSLMSTPSRMSFNTAFPAESIAEDSLLSTSLPSTSSLCSRGTDRLSLLDLSFERYRQEQQISLARKVINHWRCKKYAQMTEIVLKHAAVLKEANIISKELGKEAVYQFAISLFSDENEASYASIKNAQDVACVSVQVVDKKHNAIYNWPLTKLKTRLFDMRSLYNIKEPPTGPGDNIPDHPFYDLPCPTLTRIGQGKVTFQHLNDQAMNTRSVLIACETTGEIIGTLKVAFWNQKMPGEDFSLIELQIQELIGISPNDFDQVQVQFQWIHSRGEAGPMHHTELVDNQEGTPLSFGCPQLSHAYSTNDTSGAIQPQSILFRVYGRAQTAYLNHVLKYHFQREQSLTRSNTNIAAHPSSSACISSNPVLCDGDIIPKRYTILAWVEILELTPQGKYEPVQVVSPITAHPGKPDAYFFLRQGLQRRLKLTLTHDAGQAVAWDHVTNMRVDCIRLLDDKERQPAAKRSLVRTVPVQVVSEKQETENDPNGTCSLVVQGSWDSSLHDSDLLNRRTDTGQQVILRLSWQVTGDATWATSCLFEMDIAVQIHGREEAYYNPFMWSGLLARYRLHWKVSGIFTLSLAAQRPRTRQYLWRCDTKNNYVRGQEACLIDTWWLPRGASLINDFRAARRRMAWRDSVESTRLHLAKKLGVDNSVDVNNATRSQLDSVLLLEKVMRLWVGMLDDKERKPLSSSLEYTNDKAPTGIVRLHPHVESSLPSYTVTKSGFVMGWDSTVSAWQKQWLVLRRPFLLIHDNDSDFHHVGIVDLTSIRVTRKDTEERNTFTVHTPHRQYRFQALNHQDQMNWIARIDQFFKE